MSQVTRRGPVKPTLNITPLIDVVFLLIVFFMLVNNIVTDEVPDLKLPDLEKPQVFPATGDKRVIVNIIPENEYEGEDRGPGTPVNEVLARPGAAEFVQVGNNKWAIADKDAMTEFREVVAASIATRTASNKGVPPDIMLRADAAVYYAQVLPVMTNLQMAMAEALDPELAAQTPVHLVAYVEDE